MQRIDYQFRPLEGSWPGERTRNRQRAKFNAKWQRTMDDLERELRQLSARQVVLQVDCAESEIRRDGMLRSDARVRSPGVILSFNSKHGPLSYPCDNYHDWQDNVRAIALALAALRAVDRYGVTKRAEQYKGWAKLPAPPEQTLTLPEARGVIEALIGPVRWGIDAEVQAALRRAEVATHPDTGGDATRFKRVQNARAAIFASYR